MHICKFSDPIVPALPPLSAVAILLLAGCAASGTSQLPSAPLASSANTPRQTCESLGASVQYPGLRILSARSIAAGVEKRPGIVETIPAHCVLTGKLNERISPVDGKPYAMSFEMRLPDTWNGRFFYQANGGLDGVVVPAFGEILGGGPRTNALIKGFAVISSDAGHAAETDSPVGGGLFGLDPQARLDYGYNAVAQLTPMARAIITYHYGKKPHHSYIVGTSNGGRHAMMAAARDTGSYDGVLASAPGFRLPYAAVTEVWDAQQFAQAAPVNAQTGRPDPDKSFSPADLTLVARLVLKRCDGLDGLQDGIVSNTAACQRAFDIQRDVPVCTKPDGTCLSERQKVALQQVYAGPRMADGTAFYPGKAWDAGIAGRDWRTWKFINAVGPRDPLSLGFVFSTQPQSPASLNGEGNNLLDYALGYNLERDTPKLFAKDAIYTQSSVEFMIPPDVTGMDSFIGHGGKLIVLHGASDPVFSVIDTTNWYTAFVERHGVASDATARFYIVPGMNHSRNGPATDQFDAVDALVAWVEQGKAPQAIIATARGAASNLPNPDVPATWDSGRSRPLCPYPSVATYNGKGSVEVAESFHCESLAP